MISLLAADRGSSCVRSVTSFGEPYLVCGTAEASCTVFPSPSHTKRPVSVPTLPTLRSTHLEA